MENENAVTCGLCHYEFIHGAKVCQGCQGDVVYGSTDDESSFSGSFGAFVFGGLAAFILYALPFLLNVKFEFNLALGWGLSAIWGLGIIAAFAIVGKIYWSTKAYASRAHLVRTFRRSSIINSY